jgi:hypothetical protein
MYANGDGVRRDDGRAYLWLSLAVASADNIDRAALEKVTERLSPAARAAADRLAAACRETAFKKCGEPEDP